MKWCVSGKHACKNTIEQCAENGTENVDDGDTLAFSRLESIFIIDDAEVRFTADRMGHTDTFTFHAEYEYGDGQRKEYGSEIPQFLQNQCRSGSDDVDQVRSDCDPDFCNQQ